MKLYILEEIDIRNIMDSFKDKSIDNITKSIINSFKDGNRVNMISLGSNTKRKIQIRRVIQGINKSPSLIILEQKKRETQEWEIIFADVTLIRKDIVHIDEIQKDFKEDAYKYIGFDIYGNFIKGDISKSLFINFSYHALERIIQRCDIKKLSTPLKVKTFLSSMLKPILLRCLSMFQEKYEDYLNNPNLTKDEVLEKKESYIITDNFFMPIIMEGGKNRYGNLAFIFTIKTVMPDTYNGAQKTIKEKEVKESKGYIFDYADILSAFIKK